MAKGLVFRDAQNLFHVYISADIHILAFKIIFAVACCFVQQFSGKTPALPVRRVIKNRPVPGIAHCHQRRPTPGGCDLDNSGSVRQRPRPPFRGRGTEKLGVLLSKWTGNCRSGFGRFTGVRDTAPTPPDPSASPSYHFLRVAPSSLSHIPPSAPGPQRHPHTRRTAARHNAAKTTNTGQRLHNWHATHVVTASRTPTRPEAAPTRGGSGGDREAIFEAPNRKLEHATLRHIGHHTPLQRPVLGQTRRRCPGGTQPKQSVHTLCGTAGPEARQRKGEGGGGAEQWGGPPCVLFFQLK